MQEIISHWHPNITINIVNDYTNWAPGQVLGKLISLDAAEAVISRIGEVDCCYTKTVGIINVAMKLCKRRCIEFRQRLCCNLQLTYWIKEA
jgi:hypothetical protein